MNISRWLILAAFAAAATSGAACTRQDLDDTKHDADVALEEAEEGAEAAVEATREAAEQTVDATHEAAEQTVDATQNIAQKTADKTKEIAGAIGRTTTGVVTATGEAITDGWITTTVSADFVDEDLLKGSDINVDTQDHVVTLKGTVGSEAARARAVAIARNTKGVTRVVNQLVVK
jgi:hyperosmotically inducible protein